MQYVRSPQGKKTRQKAIQKDLRERKQKLKTKSDYLKEAQTAFNAYVRARDQRCMHLMRQWTEDKYGGGGTGSLSVYRISPTPAIPLTGRTSSASNAIGIFQATWQSTARA